jgi:hypothetical protein
VLKQCNQCDNREGHPCSITVPGVQFHEEAVRHPLRGRPLEALTPVYQGGCVRVCVYVRVCVAAV